MDFAEILEAKQPQETSVRLLLDPALETKLARVEAAAAKAERDDDRYNRPPEAPRLHDQADTLRLNIESQTVTFVFRAVGRRAWSALLDEYAPRPDNPDDEQAGYNIDEFPPRLLAAAAHDPPMTLEQAKEVWDGDRFSDGETTRLILAALQANKLVADIPFTPAGGRPATPNTAAASNTPTNTASPTPTF